MYTIKNVEERITPCQVNMSSYLYHPFIHSFWFISLISFPSLRGLFTFTALNVHLNLAIFNHSLLCYFNRGRGKNSCPILARPVIYRTKEIWAVFYLTGCGVGVSVRMWGRGCLNQSETEYIQNMIPNCRRFHFLFLTESLYQKGSAKAISEYFRIGKNEVTCCSLPARQVVKGK